MQSTEDFSIGLGNADFKRGTLDVNLPLERLGDGSALRLNGMWTDASVPGRDAAANRRWGFAPSFGLGLASSTRPGDGRSVAVTADVRF